jgi:hypothetical protein
MMGATIPTVAALWCTEVDTRALDIRPFTGRVRDGRHRGLWLGVGEWGHGWNKDNDIGDGSGNVKCGVLGRGVDERWVLKLESQGHFSRLLSSSGYGRLWPYPICPNREGEGIKGTAVLTRVLDKIKERLEGS